MITVNITVVITTIKGHLFINTDIKFDLLMAICFAKALGKISAGSNPAAATFCVLNLYRFYVSFKWGDNNAV